MGVVDKLKHWMNLDEDGDDYDDYGIDADFDDFQEKRAPQAEESRSTGKSYAGASNREVSIPVKTKFSVVLVKPEGYQDATSIADHLNDKKTVVLNLESAQREIARRIIDFLCGVAYANGGEVKRVANSTYIITPYNVGISGDLIDELENNGVFF